MLSLMLTLTGLACLGSSASALDVGDIIQFGSYPQTEVNETTSLKNAADAATWNSYFYYIGNGSYDGCMTASDYMKYADFVSGGVRYRAVKFTKYRPKLTNYISKEEDSYQDDNGYFTNTTYYFKYEPLEWRVLDPSAGLILCETVIDSQAFQNVVRFESDGWNFYIGVSSTYANNYAESSIRTWLNNDFYNTAFNTAQKGKIEPITVNNDAYRDVYSQFNAAPTTDPIFLLSHSEAQSSKYGFLVHTERKSKSTDYAKCQGCRVNAGFSGWWLRNAGDPSNNACVLESSGFTAYSYEVDSTYVGVRPACIISDLNSLVHTVTVSADPAEGGTVTGGGTYSDGQSAKLTATANSGYIFSGWYKDGSKVSSNINFSFNVTEDATYTAKFSKLTMGHIVNVSADPAEGGTVSGGGTYSDGQTAALTATPNSGWHFIGWYNGDTKVSSDSSYSFTVTEKVNLTAKFEKGSPVSYTVTVSADPAEGGTVSGGGTYESGAYATLTATPNSGWHFVGWYLDGTLSSTQQSFFRPVVSNLDYVAKFEKDTYTVTVSADPAEGGTIDGGGTYYYWSEYYATLIATPNSGYHFIGWYNGSEIFSSDASFSFNVTEDITLTAKFEKDTDAPYTVTVSADPAEGGTVSGGGAFYEMQGADITATPNSGWHFDGWYNNGTKFTSKASYSFTVIESLTLIAKFEKDTPDKPDFSNFKIKGYNSPLPVDYKSTVIFHTTMEAPDGYEIVWSNGTKGSECKLSSVTNKEYKISAKMVNKTTGGTEAVTEEVTVTVNTGFFAKIIAFFKGLFGSLPTYEDFKKK